MCISALLFLSEQDLQWKLFLVTVLALALELLVSVVVMRAVVQTLSLEAARAQWVGFVHRVKRYCGEEDTLSLEDSLDDQY